MTLRAAGMPIADMALARESAPGAYDDGLRRDGPVREIYHRFGADQEGYRSPAHVITPSAELYVTELQIPVALQKDATA